MKTLIPYLTFSGNCEEALNHYKHALGGEIVSMQTFASAQIENISEDYKNKIMHSEFKADGVVFMASDSMQGQGNIVKGDNISLSIDFKDGKEQESVFNKLATGGQITMPLQDTFWGAKFGMLVDKYGISWMLNYDKPKQ
jgi:PhnB protein